MSSTPLIFIVPGLWEGPTVFSAVTTTLESLNYRTHTHSLPSTGKLSPGNPSMKDDIASIQSALKAIVEKGETVILVLHSAGGFLGAGAMERLDFKTREERGERGGVKSIVFLTAGVMPKGGMHANLPFFDFENAPAGGMTCVSPRETLFSGLSPAKIEHWLPIMQPQPAEGWNEQTTFCGWEHVPSTYLVCENDRVVPKELQLQMAGLAGAKLESCEAGHMVMLSHPETVVRVVREAAGETTTG